MTEERLRELLHPYLDGSGAPALLLPPDAYARVSIYLELLLRWNTRTNLTAIRTEEEVATRHFGESLFAAAVLQQQVFAGATLLDLGSGAGFPGLPVQIALPGLSVTLAESQGKKAAFLQEVVRTLGVATTVWAARAEALPAGTQFDFVTLRAVDRSAAASRVAADRLKEGGVVAELAMETSAPPATLLPFGGPRKVPGSRSRFLRLWRKSLDV